MLAPEASCGSGSRDERSREEVVEEEEEEGEPGIK